MIAVRAFALVVVGVVLACVALLLYVAATVDPFGVLPDWLPQVWDGASWFVVLVLVVDGLAGVVAVLAFILTRPTRKAQSRGNHNG